MASPEPSGRVAREPHADGLRALYEQSPASLAGNAVGITLIGLAFWPIAPSLTLRGWLAAALLFWLLRLLHYLRYRRAPDCDTATLLAWRTSWRALVLLQGAMWPLAVWLFWGLGSPFHTVALIVIANSYAVASVQLLAPQRTLFMVFTSLVLLPVIARVASDTSKTWHWQLAGILGLGLAIVKRLADMLDAPLTMRSRLGHGTVFTLEVPLGREVRSLTAAPTGAAARLGITLQGKSIVVVEDEPAVHEGLTVLLAAWGAEVCAFDDVGSLQQWLATQASAAPDLLIVDYRLPQGQTGIEALTALRAHWPGQTLPAILITGSSLCGHEDEAAKHDFHLLIKPVPPNKLRAMISFKPGLR